MICRITPTVTYRGVVSFWSSDGISGRMGFVYGSDAGMPDQATTPVSLKNPYYITCRRLWCVGSAFGKLSTHTMNTPPLTRASKQAPNGYAPGKVACPRVRPAIRDSSKSVMSPQEHEWVGRRREEVIAPLHDLLKRVNIPGFDSDGYFSSMNGSSDSMPVIGMAFSGGGYRAMLNGAGAIAAFDSRSPGSTTKGNIGGLLQSTVYIAGLSGGGWLVGSIYANNFTTVQAAASSGTIWQFSNYSLFRGSKSFRTTISYWSTLISRASSKWKAGFDGSITDLWGEALSYQFVDAVDGGPGITFSSIAQDPIFASAKAPMPILTAISRAPDTKIITLFNTIFEFNPWEMGSSDPTLHGFAPLKYTGSKFQGGKLPDTEACINGFDNLGFVMGTSSSLFNEAITYTLRSDSDGFFISIAKAIVSGLLTAIGKVHDDIADWTPNPFRNFSDTFDGSKVNRLTLVDGGEDGQNIPFHPLLASERKVDVIFAVDSSADVNNWPNGTSLTNTYLRSMNQIAACSSFPSVPGPNTFVNLGLNSRPTFFGCSSSDADKGTPLVVYLPNSPFLTLSNTATLKLSYTDSERDSIIANGWAAATQLNSTRFADWDVCVGCAILSRSLKRSGTATPAACDKCFARYCWNGTVAESEPTTAYNPSLPKWYLAQSLMARTDSLLREPSTPIS
ncbi:hypothetical protein NLG97_g8660 [Lecanicillium saksenae]|uniref:Uncharacterized protein n=1 Tax=Lecanicillium saksenae TaxID=468837 RepID=A0ACC1QK85_9HYPO|nr:hypothetical protein NLG97_g8660 [Lecanicillium saksenae]